jgi:hypothetical protein
MTEPVPHPYKTIGNTVGEIRGAHLKKKLE